MMRNPLIPSSDKLYCFNLKTKKYILAEIDNTLSLINMKMKFNCKKTLLQPGTL